MSVVMNAEDPVTREAAVNAAVEAVRVGEVVVIPTDTVYGIGCDAFDAAGVVQVQASAC